MRLEGISELCEMLQPTAYSWNRACIVLNEVMLDIKSWWTTFTWLSAYTHWLQTHRQTLKQLRCERSGGRTDWRYEVHYLPASWWYTVNNKYKIDCWIISKKKFTIRPCSLIQCSQKVSWHPGSCKYFTSYRSGENFFGPVYCYRSWWHSSIGALVNRPRSRFSLSHYL